MTDCIVFWLIIQHDLLVIVVTSKYCSTSNFFPPLKKRLRYSSDDHRLHHSWMGSLYLHRRWGNAGGGKLDFGNCYLPLWYGLCTCHCVMLRNFTSTSWKRGGSAFCESGYEISELCMGTIPSRGQGVSVWAHSPEFLEKTIGCLMVPLFCRYVFVIYPLTKVLAPGGQCLQRSS